MDRGLETWRRRLEAQYSKANPAFAYVSSRHFLIRHSWVLGGGGGGV